MTDQRSFDEAIAAIRSGVQYSVCGMTLLVEGIPTLKLTSEQFDQAWDLMDEVDGLENAVISLPPPSVRSGDKRHG